MERWIQMISGELGLWDICLRLLCAMAVGLVIGTEREYTNRPAGMRTHILVALGACAVMITGQLLFRDYSLLGAMPDPARLGAQVITGVGFLGAGTILREGSNVRGLTTAASLWAVACLGLAAGAGYYSLTLLGAAMIFATLTVFEVLQNKLMGPGSGLFAYSLVTRDVAACLNALNALGQKHRVAIRELETRQTDWGYEVTFRAEIGGMGAKKRRQKFLEGLAMEKTVADLRASAREEERV